MNKYFISSLGAPKAIELYSYYKNFYGNDIEIDGAMFDFLKILYAIREKDMIEGVCFQGIIIFLK